MKIDKYEQVMMELKQKLPYQKTKEAKAKRDALWIKIAGGNHSYITMEQACKGTTLYIKLPPLTYKKRQEDAIKAAYRYAMDALPASKFFDKQFADQHVSKGQFRFFLRHLRIHYEYLNTFGTIDQNKDLKLDLDELKKGIELLKKWDHQYFEVNTAEQIFKKMNKNAGSSIMFEEFEKFAESLYKSLDQNPQLAD